MRRYQRLVRQVKKCYPLAKQARIEMENMEQQLLALGHEIAQENCDLYIINTCTVTAVADRKNRTLIRRLRREHPDAVIGVCGCYSQHDSDAVKALGVEWGIQQARELKQANVPSIHFYSMNAAASVEAIAKAVY